MGYHYKAVSSLCCGELFLVGVTAHYSGVPAAVIPLGASAKRAVPKRANHGRFASFSRCRFVRVLLDAVVSCPRLTVTSVVCSAWASNTLRQRSWMTHASIVGV